MELMYRAPSIPPVVPGDTVKASDGHLKAPPGQATEAIADITNDATKRHGCQLEPHSRIQKRREASPANNL
jgi:hypothetical protein